MSKTDDNTYKTAAEQALPYMQRALQTEAYQRTIRKVAQDLNRPERSLSRIVHASAIETPSNWMAHTIMRPAGILGGGIASLAGTVLLLYLSRFRGLNYTFSAYFALFIGGFLAGLLMESLLKAGKR